MKSPEDQRMPELREELPENFKFIVAEFLDDQINKMKDAKVTLLGGTYKCSYLIEGPEGQRATVHIEIKE